MVDLNPIIYVKSGQPIDAIHWSNGVLLPIDKPFSWTSFDVVNKVRYQLKAITGIKRFKVGHAGTLDPRATGLLLLACGKATKSIDSIVRLYKTYEGLIQLGGTTPTYDGEMECDVHYPVDHIGAQEVAEAVDAFTGVIDQIPPIFSAIKKNGKRLYEYARKGQVVEVSSRKIEIYQLELTLKENAQIEFSCRCSKGTYIRTLAHDIGRYLNSGAYLSTLRRTSIGNYSLGEAWELDVLIETMSKSNS